LTDSFTPRWPVIRGNFIGGVMYSSQQQISSPEVVELRKEAGLWLKELREKRGLSQRQMAEKVGANYASSWNRVGDVGLVSRLCLLRSNPSVRSAPSFRPDLHARYADARSGGQGWPAFGPPLQRREASL